MSAKKAKAEKTEAVVEETAKENTEEVVQEVETRTVVPLKPGVVAEQKFNFTAWDAAPPEGTRLEDLTNPVFWEHVARRLRIGDEVRVVPDDCSFYARLLVTNAVGARVQMKLIEGVQLESVDGVGPQEGPYRIELKGRLKWCVINTSTGAIEEKNIETQADAARAMGDLQRALAN